MRKLQTYSTIGAVEGGTAVEIVPTLLVLDPARVDGLERATTAGCEGVFNRDGGDACDGEDGREDESSYAMHCVRNCAG